jgi:hypothetical protein
MVPLRIRQPKAVSQIEDSAFAFGDAFCETLGLQLLEGYNPKA